MIEFFGLLIILVIIITGQNSIKERLSSIERRLFNLTGKQEGESGVIKGRVDVALQSQTVDQTSRHASSQEKTEPTVQHTPVNASVSNQTMNQSVHETVAQPVPQQVKQTKPVIGESNDITSGKILGRIGIVAVFIGVALFLQYAFANNLIGEVGRIVIGVLFGAGFLAVGQLLRKKYLQFSSVLIGGGIGIFYLTIFATYYYSIANEIGVIVLMLITTAISMYFAAINDSKEIAVVGMVGGFLTPIFISGSNTNIGSFMTYLLLLNIGLIGFLSIKKWNALIPVAFIGTILASIQYTDFGVGLDKNRLTLVSIFNLVYFLIFVSAGLMDTVLKRGVMTGRRLFFVIANALYFSTVAYNLLEKVGPELQGTFFFVLAVLYTYIAFVSYSTDKEDRVGNIAYALMGIGFLLIAIPIQLDGPWIPIAWFVVATVVYIFASYIRSIKLFTIGSCIYVFSFCYTLIEQNWSGINFENFNPFINGRFWLYMFIVVCTFIIYYCFKFAGLNEPKEVLANIDDGKFRMLPHKLSVADKEGVMKLASVFLILANIVLLLTVTFEVNAYYNQNIHYASIADSVGGNTNCINSDCTNPNNNRVSSLQNQNKAVGSILWAIYAMILIAVGFYRGSAILRRLGLILFFITAFKLLIDVWQIGEIYRIVSSIGFGLLAIITSFLYAKFFRHIEENG